MKNKNLENTRKKCNKYLQVVELKDLTLFLSGSTQANAIKPWNYLLTPGNFHVLSSNTKGIRGKALGQCMVESWN